MTDDPVPWWATNPEIAAIRRRAIEELEAVDREPIEFDKPDAVVDEWFSGACWRELAAARDDLARARYEDAVLAARAAGFSWSEIGRTLGVSRQQLHRRFNRLGSTAAS